MLNRRTTWLAATLCGWACLLTAGASRAAAQDKKESGNAETSFSKSDEPTADDEKDTTAQTKKSHRKSYQVKLTEGKAYRIDLRSKDFDTLLRVENADGKQVALLAPTTVLAFQHLKTVKDRFAAFPVRTDMVSRFRTKAEQKAKSPPR